MQNKSDLVQRVEGLLCEASVTDPLVVVNVHRTHSDRVMVSFRTQAVECARRCARSRCTECRERQRNSELAADALLDKAIAALEGHVALEGDPIKYEGYFIVTG